MDQDRDRPPESGSAETVSAPAVTRLFARLDATPLPKRVALALFALLLAFGLRSALSDLAGERAFYIAYCPAIAVVALLLGIYGGVAATLFVVAPTHFSSSGWRIAPNGGFEDAPTLAAALINATIVIFLARMAQICARTQAAHDESFRRNAEQLGHFVEQTPAAMAMFDRDMRYLALRAFSSVVDNASRENASEWAARRGKISCPRGARAWSAGVCARAAVGVAGRR